MPQDVTYDVEWLSAFPGHLLPTFNPPVQLLVSPPSVSYLCTMSFKLATPHLQGSFPVHIAL